MEPKTSRRIHASLAPQIDEMLSELAEEKGISKSAVIALAIERYYRENEREKKIG
jgi:hypothetical protein